MRYDYVVECEWKSSHYFPMDAAHPMPKSQIVLSSPHGLEGPVADVKIKLEVEGKRGER